MLDEYRFAVIKEVVDTEDLVKNVMKSKWDIVISDLSKGKEPLKTLATYRLKNNNVYFGQNLLHDGSGEIKIGDERY